MSEAEPEVAGEDGDGYALAHQQDWVAAQQAVDEDERGAHDADYPEWGQQQRLTASHAHHHLIGVAADEDKLCRGAVDHQPERNEGVVDEAVDKLRGAYGDAGDSHHGHGVEEYPQQPRQLAPRAFVIEVEHIHVERQYLSEQDDDVGAHPAVPEHKAASGKRECPVAGGRGHSPQPLGHYPLHQLPRAVAQLRQQPYYQHEGVHVKARCRALRLSILLVEVDTLHHAIDGGLAHIAAQGVVGEHVGHHVIDHIPVAVEPYLRVDEG